MGGRGIEKGEHIMGVRISGPHLGPVHTTLWSSGGRKSGGGGGCLGVFLALALLGGAFGVSPILGWLVIVAAVVIFVAWLVHSPRPAKPAAGEPAEPAAKPDGPPTT